jgi:hypothetical protein
MKGRHGKVGGPRTHRDARKEEREVGQASQYLVYRVRKIHQGKNETHCSRPLKSSKTGAVPALELVTPICLQALCLSNPSTVAEFV